MIAACACATVDAQQPSGPPAPERLSEGVYWLRGARGDGNTGIVVERDGVVVVDAKMTAASARQMLAAIRELTPLPVTTVILTHSDGDHVNGLAGFPAGLTIIAHPNCKADMIASVGSRDPAPQDRLPTVMVDTRASLAPSGVRLTLLHSGPAHTNGDLQVYLPDRKIVFAGDVLNGNQPYPLIHANKGGISSGWVDTVKALLALDADVFVSGHGDLLTREGVAARLAVVEARRARIRELADEKKSLAEIRLALGDVDPPATGGFRFTSLTEVVYKEITQLPQ